MAIIMKNYCLICQEFISDLDNHLKNNAGHICSEVQVNSVNPTPGVEFVMNKEFNKKVFALTGLRSDPTQLNFCIECLAKKVKMVRGDIVKEEYFKEYDESTKEYKNLVVWIEREYEDDEDQLPIKRITRIKYPNTDGTIGYEKIKMKYYTEASSIAARQKRLSNRLNQVKAYLAESLQQYLPSGIKAFEDLLLNISNVHLHDVAIMIGESHPYYSFFINNDASVMGLYADGNTDALKLYTNYVELDYFTTEHRNMVLSIL